MEDILNQIEAEEGPGKVSPLPQHEIAQALARFTKALRLALPLLEGEAKVDEFSGTGITAQWLLDTVAKVPSELSVTQLARAVHDASFLPDEGQKQEALFAALGASEEAMIALVEIAPHLHEIQRNIAVSDLGGENLPTTQSSFVDEEERNRQRLRQEALDASQVAAILQAEVDNRAAMSGLGSTHSVARSSDIEAKKMAGKAAKRAAQALQRAKAAGAIIDEDEMLNVDGSTLGGGGLVGRTQDELQALQESLLPEGSRVHHKEKGLPNGTERESTEEFEKVTIPPPKLNPASLHHRLKIDDIMDPISAIAFSGTDSLNPMQSTVFDTAFHRRENMLVCAPTGAGKTNVAMLTLMAHFRDVGLVGDGEKSNLDAGTKVVYIAPMKALAQEVVEKYSSKLKPLKLIVKELTGDMQLTRAEAQAANVLVTTPEKWDVVTRKAGNDDSSLGNQCGLLIIDEVHLLADERGAVIESVVSRLHRLVESRQRQLRIVGLSATLPNYQDVAEFLQVPARGLYFFGPEHRPVPLQQQFIGVFGTKRYEIEERMNKACYETVRDSLERGYQVMVFVHSRKGTGDAASALAQSASANGELDRYFVTAGKEGPQGEAYKRYADRVKKSRNREVANHFYNGMGIHHAGMLRGDRKLSESMFADGAIRVLCTTATLAWGINLPAHTVIIKGTDVYNPEKGKNSDLSILDVQQIFGRAGRPQFDTSGEATLITNHAAMTRYLDKLVRAVPIESSFIKQLADHLNAEIVGGTVTNVAEAASWLKYTYLYVRMLKNPLAYGITPDQKLDDPVLRNHCLDLVKQAAVYLNSIQMVTYDDKSGNLSMTASGRVAAHFYIQTATVSNFRDTVALPGTPSDTQLLSLIASATEFENIRVRQEEQSELDSLQKKCPLTLEGPVNDASTKTFVLMQIYISGERPKSFTLISDMNYIASNAGRVARAIFEMYLHLGKGAPALKLLRLAKSVDNQFWWFQTPLRHFDGEIGRQVVSAVETHQGSQGYSSLESALSLLDLTAEEVGQICKSKKVIGQKVQQFIRMIPNATISCKVLPITTDIFRFLIHIDPDFKWHGRWHGNAVGFWYWVEDLERQQICHYGQFMFNRRTHPQAIQLDIPIPRFSNVTQYLIRIVADSWVGVETVFPVSPSQTRTVEQGLKHTDLLDLKPLPISVLQNDAYEKIFSKIKVFNPMQTQLFHTLYHSDTPIFLGAPTGSGKTVVAELAVLRMKRLYKDGICIYIAPLKSLARERLNEWRRKFGAEPLNWKIMELSGDARNDQRDVEGADILVCTPEKWDLVSRGWLGNRFGESGDRKRSESFVKRVRLLVIDEIHLLGEERGAVLEAIVSRTRFISRHLQQTEEDAEPGKHGPELVRIVGLSTAVSNPVDLANWIGIKTDGHGPTVLHGLYNFRPSIRPVPTEVHVQGYPGKHYCPRMATMNKPCYAAIKGHAPDRPALIFVASRRQTRLTAFDLISYAAADENPKTFLGCDDVYVEAIAESIEDDALRHTITFGIGLHHAGLSVKDREVVERMFLNGEIRVLVATATLAWGVNLPARLVIVKGTEYFDGKSSRYVDYPLTDVLQMIGRAGRPGFDTEGRAVVMVQDSKKDYYKKFLYSPYPVESCLMGRIGENVNAEIATGTVKTIVDALGYLSWTFFARRVKANPSYYGASSSNPSDVELFLESVIKGTILSLEREGCVEVEGSIDSLDSQVRATSLGEAVCGYYLVYQTAKQMQDGLYKCAELIMQEASEHPVSLADSVPSRVQPFYRDKHQDELSISWLLYTLSWTHEFDELPVRHNEELLNEELSKSLMWGPDTSSIPTANRRKQRIDSEIFESPNTKCFLLIQAHLQKARLPISDFVNDTKTVMDNAPRVLAAMLFVACSELNTHGMFEVVCQLYRTKQLLSTRSTLRTDPIVYHLGIGNEAISPLSKHIQNAPVGDGKSAGVIQSLRSMPRDGAAGVLKKVPRGQLGKPLRPILDALYQVPLITLIEANIKEDNKAGPGRRSGVLNLKLELETVASKESEFATLGIVLGTVHHKLLLAHSEVSISRGGKRSIEKVIPFDWSMANEDGAGFVILRFLQSNFRGLDMETQISLK